MTTVVEEIKSRIKLEELVGETLTLTGRGRVLSTKEHDSLKVRTDWQWFEWYSRGLRGDVFDWWQIQQRCDFRTALEDLARRAGVELAPLTPVEQAALDERRWGEKVLGLAAEHYHRMLTQHPAGREARAWCQGRGWSSETIEREQIGFAPAAPAASDNNALSDAGAAGEGAPLATALREAGLLDHPTAKAVLSMPGGMVVYVHRVGGRAVFLSGRSIEGRRHYALPADLVGEKQVYVNAPAAGGPGALVLVEGPADAIALGQVGVAAVALCGVAPSVLGAGKVRRWEFSHVGLDMDAAGEAAALEVALAIDPLCRVVRWPQSKDAAAWVQKVAPTRAMVEKVLDDALRAIVALAYRVRGLRDDDRRVALRRLMDGLLDLDEITATDVKENLAQAMGVGVQQFNRLLKAREKEREAEGNEKDNPLRYERCAGGAIGGWVWEQCVVRTPDGQCQVSFAVRTPDGQISVKPMVEVAGTCYLPYAASTRVITRDVVHFPEKPMAYGAVRDLVAEIRRFLHRYLDVDPFYERMASYYVVFSWMYDLFENLPYLRALGDYGTGKTRFIQTIGALCYRPMFVSGATTVSPVFRLLDAFRGTLVIDEADFNNSDAENEIIKILNVGYYRGGVVLRSEKDPDSDVYFPSVNEVYGPKILATRKPFQDRATESRCLTKRMTTRRPRPGIPYTLSAEFWAEATAIRNKLLMYRLSNHRPITLDQSLADESVEPRLNQVTLALKTIIDNQETRDEIDLFIRAYNEQMIGERQLTVPAIVLSAVVAIFWETKRNLLGDDERDLSMKGIATKAQEILQDIDPDVRLTARKVSMVLNEDLGLTRRQNHSRTNRSMLLVDEAELVALMGRYGIADPRVEGGR
jgi:DNA primase